MPPIPAEQQAPYGGGANVRVGPSPYDDSGDVHVAARHTGLSKSWLDKQRALGAGPPYFKIGRRVVYRLAALDAWMAKHRITTEATT
jgi:predicted DNA-binding transcriptional regulator AlpA